MQKSWVSDHVRNGLRVEQEYWEPARAAWFQHRPCPVCGSDEDPPILFEVRGHRYLRCRRCGMVYVGRILNPARLTEYYNHPLLASYFRHLARERTDAGQAQIPSYLGRKALKRFFMAPVSNDATRVRELASAGTLLDVGCGAGDFLSSFPEAYSRIGIETNSDAAAQARNLGITVHNSSINEAELPAASCDAITLLQVIEHLADPARVVARLAGALRPGGVLYVNCPNVDSVSLRLFGNRHTHLSPLAHINMFSPVTLARLLSEAGLETVLVGTENLDIAASDLAAWLLKRKSFVHRMNATLPPTVDRLWRRGSGLRPLHWTLRRFHLGSYVFAAGRKT